MTDLEAEIESQQDPRIALMAEVYFALVDDRARLVLRDEEEIRSALSSDTVDVRIGAQWYRISAAPIPKPISLDEHRGVISDD
jgi:hypothetical protein